MFEVGYSDIGINGIVCWNTHVNGISGRLSYPLKSGELILKTSNGILFEKLHLGDSIIVGLMVSHILRRKNYKRMPNKWQCIGPVAIQGGGARGHAPPIILIRFFNVHFLMSFQRYFWIRLFI